MRIEIDDAIITAATRCSDSFSCMSGDLSHLCKVEDCIAEDIHFVRCVDEPSCNYKIPFAKEYVCTCPVRQEIFNCYRI